MEISIRSPMEDIDLSTAQIVQVEHIANGPVTLEPVKASITARKPYTGEYEFTPGDEQITIPTTGLSMTKDVIINPIPSNYGKILWNGSELSII